MTSRVSERDLSPAELVGLHQLESAEWVPKHPGGAEVLRLCAGRECTELMMSYHPFTDKPWKVLEDYKIGVCTDKEFPTYERDSGFWREVKTAVGDYFRENGIDSKDWMPGLWRMVPVFIVATLLYCVMHDIPVPGLEEFGSEWSWGVKMGAAALYGLFQALPLLHVMHDACHCAISHSETVQQMVGRFTLDWFAGCSMLSWQHQHVVGHHVYTNVYQADPDLPEGGGDPRRLVSKQPWAWVYQFQWLYMPVLYGLLGLKMRYDDITSVWLARRDGPVRVNFFDPVAIRVFAVKGSWFLWRIVLPIVLLKQPVTEVLALFLIAEFVTGYWLAFNFQVSHISTEATWPEIKDPVTKELDCEWAPSQVTTGVNYYANPFGDFLCGALNYQIEHHLFPCVSQYHYPAIAPIVERVSKKYGLKYNSLPSYTAALTAHLRHLYDLGIKGEAAPFHLD
jgi:fatty acid desaturase